MQTRVGGVTVSLPDATRSDRVYPLLQNLDLENLAFATVQGVGNTLNIEEMNEDELRRLVLVNLARLTVAGEWNGLLTAASGGGAATFAPIDMTSWAVGTTVSGFGFNYVSGSSSNRDFSYYATPEAFPIIAQVSGTIDSLTIDINTAEVGVSALVGIYEDTDGLPAALLGTATISADATGYITQTSFSASIELTAGSAYWICFGTDDATSTAEYRRLSTLPGIGIVEPDSEEYQIKGWAHSGAATSLPDPFVPTAKASFRPLAYYTVA